MLRANDSRPEGLGRSAKNIIIGGTAYFPYVSRDTREFSAKRTEGGFAVARVANSSETIFFRRDNSGRRTRRN